MERIIISFMRCNDNYSASLTVVDDEIVCCADTLAELRDRVEESVAVSVKDYVFEDWHEHFHLAWVEVSEVDGSMTDVDIDEIIKAYEEKRFIRYSLSHYL